MKPSLEKYAKDTFERENQFKKLEKLSSEKQIKVQDYTRGAEWTG